MKLYTGGIVMALDILTNSAEARMALMGFETCMDFGDAGKIFIIAGKSASGKDTVLKRMVKDYDFQPIISTTSRPMRSGEVEGVDYFFISEEGFKNKIEHNEFLEYRSYNTCVAGNDATWYHGSIKQELDSHKYYVVVLDMEGTKSFIDYYGKDNCFVAYIEALDSIREKRASNRGSFDKTEWDRRLADDEIKFNNNILADTINFAVTNNSNDGDDSIECVVNDILIAASVYFRNKYIHPDTDIFINYDLDVLEKYGLTGKLKGPLFTAVERSKMLGEWKGCGII